MFAKIFSQIYDSSIVEDPDMRFTFMDMLVLADSTGVVDMTHEAIARRTNRPIEIVRATIIKLESPDHRSRTPDAEGRRLKRLDEHRDWGWAIVNYDVFRRIASEEQRREGTRSRVATYRAKIRGNDDVTDGNAAIAGVPGGNASNAMKREMQMQKEKEPMVGNELGFSVFWSDYPRKISKQAAFQVWKRLRGVDIAVLLAALANQKQSQQWVKDGGQFIPHPKTWLNQRRWEDELKPSGSRQPGEDEPF